MYFSFQGEFLLFFSVKKEVTPQQWALRLEPVLSHYVWPHLCGLLRKTRALSRVLLFPSSHPAFICHIMKYKGICCNLFCQSRQGSKLSQAFSHLVSLSVSKGLEKVMPSRFQMSRLSRCIGLQPHLVQRVLLWGAPCKGDLNNLETVMGVGNQRVAGSATVP